MKDGDGAVRKMWARSKAVDIILRAAREIEALERDPKLSPYGNLDEAVAGLRAEARRLVKS